MTRTFDPRSRYRHPTPADKALDAAYAIIFAKPNPNPTGSAGKRLIQGGQPSCKFCEQPATEIALPAGTPVCAAHGDTRR